MTTLLLTLKADGLLSTFLNSLRIALCGLSGAPMPPRDEDERCPQGEHMPDLDVLQQSQDRLIQELHLRASVDWLPHRRVSVTARLEARCLQASHERCTLRHVGEGPPRAIGANLDIVELKPGLTLALLYRRPCPGLSRRLAGGRTSGSDDDEREYCHSTSEHGPSMTLGVYGDTERWWATG
jgi:hypothetical protein